MTLKRGLNNRASRGTIHLSTTSSSVQCHSRTLDNHVKVILVVTKKLLAWHKIFTCVISFAENLAMLMIWCGRNAKKFMMTIASATRFSTTTRSDRRVAWTQHGDHRTQRTKSSWVVLCSSTLQRYRTLVEDLFYHTNTIAEFAFPSSVHTFDLKVPRNVPWQAEGTILLRSHITTTQKTNHTTKKIQITCLIITIPIAQKAKALRPRSCTMAKLLTATIARAPPIYASTSFAI